MILITYIYGTLIIRQVYMLYLRNHRCFQSVINNLLQTKDQTFNQVLCNNSTYILPRPGIWFKKFFRIFIAPLPLFFQEQQTYQNKIPQDCNTQRISLLSGRLCVRILVLHRVITNYVKCGSYCYVRCMTKICRECLSSKQTQLFTMNSTMIYNIQRSLI